MLLFFLTGFFAIKILEPKLFPIHRVKIVSENDEINIREARKIVTRQLKGFFSTDMLAIRDSLHNLPEADKINVKRIWPDSLVIQITAQKLVAKWGKHGSVNSRGEVVTKNVPENETVPLFNGPQGQSLCMLQEYQTLSDYLKNLGLTITELNLSERRAWQLVLNNKVQVMLGRKDVENRFIRFVNVWPRLNKIHHGKISTVDLRYSNGVSILEADNI